MRTILFYEELDKNHIVVEAVPDGWKESIEKSVLTVWLKQAYAEKRILKQDALCFVCEETMLARRLALFPNAANASQRLGMAKSMLTPELGERPKNLLQFTLDTSRDAQTFCALAAVRPSAVEKIRALFGSYTNRLKVMGKADWLLSKAGSTPQDGYYLLEERFETAVVAVQSGRVIDARAAGGTNGQLLFKELLEAHQKLSYALPETLYVLKSQTACTNPELMASMMWPLLSVKPTFSGDRVGQVLFFGCVVVPLVFMLVLRLLPVPAQEETQEAQAEMPVARVSDYSMLMTAAYEAKSERVTLLSQEAENDWLAISGQAPEALDVADYMRRLSDRETDLHPLLLEMGRVNEESAHHYDFIIQISREETKS